MYGRLWKAPADILFLLLNIHAGGLLKSIPRIDEGQEEIPLASSGMVPDMRKLPRLLFRTDARKFKKYARPPALEKKSQICEMLDAMTIFVLEGWTDPRRNIL
jgi:hypothetical protein